MYRMLTDSVWVRCYGRCVVGSVIALSEVLVGLYFGSGNLGVSDYV